MTKEELMAEEHICNGKCQDDITRNYVRCKTCTRLKDFLAGYKVGKTELEKENAELKERNTSLLTSVENLNKSVQELEKENAELKESGSVICDRLSERIDETVELKNENIGLKNQLTKAKKIIKTLLRLWNDVMTEETVKALIVEAEQFLKEVDK